MNDNRCVCCGEIIPEGVQVCKMCQMKAERQEVRKEKHKMSLFVIALILLFIAYVIKTM